MRGDVAWGGNWFYLNELATPPLEMGTLAASHRRLRYTGAVMVSREPLSAASATGEAA